MRTSFISLILLLLLGACSRPEVTERLAHAERIMNAHPDSALQLLRAIDAPHKLRGKERADYAWLLTQAYDKNYLDSLQSDSLIALATDYYADNADAVRAGKAFFYQGKVLALQGKDSLAMVSYLEAEKKLYQTNEFKLKALVQEMIGKLNANHRLYEDAKDNFQLAIALNKIISDTLGITYNYRHLASIYINEERFDSTRYFVDLALSFLKDNYHYASYSSLMQLKGKLEEKSGNLSQAIHCFLQALKYAQSSNAPYHYLMSLGNIYLQQKEYEKADSCFNNILQSSNVWTQAGAYHYLYKLENERRNYLKALCYKEKSDSLLAIDKNIRLQNELHRMQKKSQIHFHTQEKNALIYQKKWLIVTGVIILLLLGFIFIKYIRSLAIIKMNKSDKSKYSEQLKDYQLREEATNIENRQLREDLEQKSQELLQKDESLKEQKECTRGLFLLKELRTRHLLVSQMSQQDKRDLYKMVDNAYNNYATYLREKYSLTDSTLLFPILLKFNFSTEDLCMVYECDKEALRKRKLRLKKLLGVPEEEKIDVFLKEVSPKMSRKTEVLK